MNTTSVLTLLFVFFFTNNLVLGQTPDWLWAASAGGSGKGNGVARSAKIHSDGSVYVTGYFLSSSITFGTTTLINKGGSNIFVVKYDTTGNVLWAKGAGGTGSGYAFGVGVDGSGNAYVMGYFDSPSITFGATTLTNAGGSDIFLVKYDVNGNVVWATSAGGTGSDVAYSVGVDGSGNAYVTGYFDSPSISFGATTLTNAGGSDIFLVKYDVNGNVVWATSAGGTGSDVAWGVACDRNGNIYVAGEFSSSTISFGRITLTNVGAQDLFLVKYDSRGNALWANGEVVQERATEIAYSVATDASGNVYLVGKFGGITITFGGTKLTKKGGGSNIFLVKYDANGSVLWARNAGDIGFFGKTFVAVDSIGNAYLAGYFDNRSISFGATTLTNAGGSDIFLVKYDVGGDVLWARSAGGIGWDVAYAVIADARTSVYVVGYYESSTITFGARNLTNQGGSDVFIVRYHTSGNVVWARNAGGAGIDYAWSVATDLNGNIYVTGSFTSFAISFGTTTLTNAGGSDIFLVKYDVNGNVVWATSAGGTGSDVAYSVGVDGSGNAYVTGYFDSPSISFGATTLTNAGGSDIFLVKYDVNGNVVWATSAGGTGSDVAWGVACDRNGNIYVAGEFSSSTITFGTTALTNAGGVDIFLVRYQAGGNVVWAKSAGGAGTDRAWSVATNDIGNVNLAGEFSSSTITFGTTTLTNAGNSDVFIVGYDSDGNAVWAKSGGGDGFDWARSIATDYTGNVYVVGSFYSSTISIGSVQLANAGPGSSDLFVVKLDAFGNVSWAKSSGGTNEDRANGVATDRAGAMYVTGRFNSSTLSFGSIHLTNINTGYPDIFLMKYDASGNVLWAKSAGGIGRDYATSVATGSNDNVYVVGSLQSSFANFGSITLSKNTDFAGYAVLVAGLGAAPALSSPANGATNQPTTLTLSWSAVSGATSYRLQVSTNQNFSPRIFDDSTITTTSRQVGPLAYNTTYYWRVSAKNTGGTGTYSGTYSAPWSFTTASDKLVTSPGISFPSDPTNSTDYRLVSFPGASSLRVGDLLSGDQNTDWRIFRETGSPPPNNLLELGSNSFFSIGEGYWLIKKGTFSFSRSVTMPQLSGDGTYTISVRNGWNIIGNPFDTAIPWSSIQSANGTSNRLWSYEGTSGFVSTSTLEPFRGYYFYSNQTTLKIPYPFPTLKHDSPPAPPIDWQLQLALRTAENEDRQNYVGISPAARETVDELDEPKPPVLSGQAALVFSRPEWNTRVRAFSSDFRPAVGEGQEWEFIVMHQKRGTGCITFSGVRDIPPEYDVVLINEQNTAPFDLRRSAEYSFQIVADTMRFRLVVGTKEYVQRRKAAFVPLEFDVSQNFPNPFNAYTTMRYQLPRPVRVQIDIFSVLGQRVKTLASGLHEAGFYTVVWDGTDDTRNAVASGVYFFRILVEDKPFRLLKAVLMK